MQTAGIVQDMFAEETGESKGGEEETTEATSIATSSTKARKSSIS